MLRVIIVDDEYFFRNALKSNMPWEENGMAVVGDANDGPTGLALLLREKPDVAIVDINMPVYNGLELIRRAQNAGVECRYILLTGYDEFKYAQSAVSLGVSSYVLKPVDFSELTQVLLLEKEKLRREKLRHSQAEELCRQARKLQLDRGFCDLVNCRLSQEEAEPLRGLLGAFSGFRIALFCVKGVSSAEEAGRLRDQLTQGSLPSRFRVFVDEKNRLAVLFDARGSEEATALISAILKALKTEMGAPDVGVGRGYPAFENIYLSYNEALIAMRNHFIYSQFAEAGREGVRRPPDEEKRNRLRLAVRDADAPRAEALLREMYQEICASRAGYDQLVLFTLDLTSLLFSVLENRGVDSGALLSGEMGLLERLERFQTVDAFSHWTVGLYAEGIRRVREQNNALGGVTARVKRYIDSRLGESDLTINRVAAELHLNYSYICVSFKKDTGTTVNDYILSKRLQRAKEMFREGAVNVACVAGEVGFSDPNYFSKCFRKKEGVSPSDFVRSLAGE